MYILFDIGGTKMRIAASHDLEKFEEPIIIPTPRDFNEGITAFKDAVINLSHGEDIEAIAGGIAGPFSGEKCTLVGSPNLKDWINKPLRDELKNAFTAPVYIENDAALAGLGEATAGAGKGYDIVAYITVGTGMGGVRIVRGKIDQKTIGFEPGHQIIDIDKSACPNCDGNYLGDYVSGKGLKNRIGKDPHEITDENTWDELARWLAYGLNNTIVHWSPEVVVLGGSMIVKKPGISVERVKEHLKDILRIFPELPEIKEAELADFGGVHGALEFMRQHSN